jgi:hypothetical protein
VPQGSGIKEGPVTAGVTGPPEAGAETQQISRRR